MDVIARTLNGIDGGRVLDVGTHAGHFVQVLKNNLNSYAEIASIDIDGGTDFAQAAHFNKFSVLTSTGSVC